MSEQADEIVAIRVCSCAFRGLFEVDDVDEEEHPAVLRVHVVDGHLGMSMEFPRVFDDEGEGRLHVPFERFQLEDAVSTVVAGAGQVLGPLHGAVHRVEVPLRGVQDSVGRDELSVAYLAEHVEGFWAAFRDLGEESA